MAGIALAFAGMGICVASWITTVIVYFTSDDLVSMVGALSLLSLCQSVGCVMLVAGIACELKD